MGTDESKTMACVDCTEPVDAQELCGGRLEDLLPKEIFLSVVALRRMLHRTPELAFHEFATAATLRRELCSIDGVELLDFPAGGTGVLAIIEGSIAGGATILFRADMVWHAITLEVRKAWCGIALTSSAVRCRMRCPFPRRPWRAARKAKGSTMPNDVRRRVVRYVVAHHRGKQQ